MLRIEELFLGRYNQGALLQGWELPFWAHVILNLRNVWILMGKRRLWRHLFIRSALVWIFKVLKDITSWVFPGLVLELFWLLLLEFFYLNELIPVRLWLPRHQFLVLEDILDAHILPLLFQLPPSVVYFDQVICKVLLWRYFLFKLLVKGLRKIKLIAGVQRVEHRSFRLISTHLSLLRNVGVGIPGVSHRQGLLVVEADIVT